MLLVAVGLYLTNSFNRDQFRLQQKTTQQQQDLALNGQRADRFVKAIDQLGQEGNDKLGIRVGGIYALETLMRDSPGDENTIIEVLGAFIRTHSPRPKVIPKPVPSSPVDVRAALSVLGRRPDPDSHRPVDLANTLLGLDHIDLRRADLRDTSLPDADLRGANLYGANLRAADLNRADLADADLIDADLGGADLGGADLDRAVLDSAYLDLTLLRGASLRGAFLTAAHLRYANLTRADLTRADLTSADLRGAHLSGAQLGCTTTDKSTKLPTGVPIPPCT